jgi:hypothetical protein
MRLLAAAKRLAKNSDALTGRPLWTTGEVAEYEAIRIRLKPARVPQPKKPRQAVLLVLLTADFETIAIFRAERQAVRDALTKPGSKARNQRGQLSISKFKAIGNRVWSSASGRSDVRRWRVGVS